MADKTLFVKIKSIFSPAQSRANITSGENLETSLGKISKWFSDIGSAAFKDVPSSGNAGNSEVVLGNDSRLSDDRTPTAHTQASNTITAMTGYSKPASTSAIAATDTLNQAIGKLEKGLEDAGGGGDLAAHIAAHVEDTNGVHGIRCKNGALEVWNEYTQTWCDPSEVGFAIGNVSNLVIRRGDLSLTITWSDPADTDDATWAGTKLVMGAGAFPENVTDGTLLVNSTTRDAYATNGYTINNLTAGTTYYFKLFPYTTDGYIANKSANQISTTAKILNSWDMLQDKVRANDMSDISIGEYYTCSRGSGTITWVDVGKNKDIPADTDLSHTLTLRTRYLLPDSPSPAFDAAEAFYACLSAPLNPGTYYYKISTTSSYSYTFTLTQTVPIGGQLVCTDNSTLKSYASPSSTTPLETVSVSTSGSGTYLGQLSTSMVKDNLNLDSWRKCGSTNWKDSAIRQWLNSNKPAGQWWTPQTPWDRPPDYAETMNGFLYDLDPEFLEVIGKTQVATKYYDAYTGTASTDITEDYFFLMSTKQVGSTQVADEGTQYDYYSDNASRKMYKSGTLTGYILRSSSGYTYVYYVATDGTLKNSQAYTYYGYPFAPTCNII